MDFRAASDTLFSRVSHELLAEQIGVSVAAIRQARLDSSAKAYRHPPKDWQRAVVELAEDQVRRYQALIGALSARSDTARGV